MDQLTLFGGADRREEPAAVYWLGFTLDHDEAAAQAAFAARFGVRPATVERGPGLLFVGPVPAGLEYVDLRRGR